MKIRKIMAISLASLMAVSSLGIGMSVHAEETVELTFL